MAMGAERRVRGGLAARAALSSGRFRSGFVGSDVVVR